eukprot:SAG31_NODE_28358_length_411_cov_0.926282_2_plen_74_part_00
MYYHTLNGVTHLDGAEHGEVLYRGEKELNACEQNSNFQKDYEVNKIVKQCAYIFLSSLPFRHNRVLGNHSILR